MVPSWRGWFFRCDAGYMVPLPRLESHHPTGQNIFPNTLFLLEGLGGGWQDTENLLQSGGMQWAYSELFQNYAANEVGPYLDHCLYASKHAGLLVHYAETHDNQRLAAHSAGMRKLKNGVCCAIASAPSPVLAEDMVSPRVLNGSLMKNSTYIIAEVLTWDSEDHIIPEIKRLNDILANHPCFLDTSKVERLCPVDSSVYALMRVSPTAKKSALGKTSTVIVSRNFRRVRPINTSTRTCSAKR